MDINSVKNLIEFIVNKEQSSSLTPDEINEIVSMAQRNYISYLLGSFQRYQPGRPVAVPELGNNQVVRQRLSPVIYGITIAVDVQGFSPYPGDYLQADAMWSIYGNARVRYIEQDKLFGVVNSVIDPVASNPIYLIEDEGFRFYPNTIGNAKLSYVRNPPNVQWGFTYNIYGQPVYDQSTSVQPIFGDLAIFEIITRALSMVGINLQANQISAYAEQIKREGQ